MGGTLFALALFSLAKGSGGFMDDDQLVQRAQAFFSDKQNVGVNGTVFGLHKGLKVVLFETCSDVCPAYTVRIIHYDVAMGPKCDAAGGVETAISVPVSIGVTQQDFCIPAVLYQKNLFTDHPFMGGASGSRH